MSSVLIFIIVLSVLVFVHELGHFLFARLFKIKVHSFAIGFQPTLFKWKPKNSDTTYKINALPFGGYVHIHGQDPSEEVSEEDKKDPSAFYNKTWWQKVLVLIGGVLFNIIFAYLLLVIMLSIGTWGPVTAEEMSQHENIQTVVSFVGEDSPAQKAGIEIGDQIISLSNTDEYQYNPEVQHADEFIALFHQELDAITGEPYLVTIQKVGEEKLATVELIGEENSEGERRVGLGVASVAFQKFSFGESLGQAAVSTWYMTGDVIRSFGQIISGQISAKNLAGPVGLVGMVGDAAQSGFTQLLFFTILISLNLAVLNLIPLPVLDGGRIVFVLLEAIMRRKIPIKAAQIVNLVGVLLLGFLMVFVTVQDIARLF